MILKKLFSGEVTNEQGELVLGFEFNGFVEELNIDYGDLGLDTEIRFVTSTGREIKFTGNDSSLFPVSPVKSFNEDRYFQNIGMDGNVFKRYVNAGWFGIFVSNADAGKVLRKIEVIYET